MSFCTLTTSVQLNDSLGYICDSSNYLSLLFGGFYKLYKGKHPKKQRQRRISVQTQKTKRQRGRNSGKLFRSVSTVSLLTLQLFSSSAFTMIVPHFFPGIPLWTTHTTNHSRRLRGRSHMDGVLG